MSEQQPQNSKLNLLKRQIEHRTLPHAYLFLGTDKAGKEEAIELILKHFFGDSWNLNPDFMELNKIPITIDDIRFFKSRAYSSPLIGEKNVFLIRGLENLSRDAAPALLKVLEDPPQSFLILAETSHSSSILPTIKSRFAQLSFARKDKSSEEADSTLWSFEKKARTSFSQESVLAFARALWAKKTMEDPTINKRLLNEYLEMIK